MAVGLERRRLTREDLAALLEECREAFAAALLAMEGVPGPASQTAAGSGEKLDKNANYAHNRAIGALSKRMQL